MLTGRFWPEAVTTGQPSSNLGAVTQPGEDNMKTREISYAAAADILSAWADRRLSLGPQDPAIDFTLETACDGLCRWLADDPERDLSEVPLPLLVHLRQRLLFAVGAAMTRKVEIIGRIPADAPPEQLLAALLGVQLAGTRLPSGWRPQ